MHFKLIVVLIFLCHFICIVNTVNATSYQELSRSLNAMQNKIQARLQQISEQIPADNDSSVCFQLLKRAFELGHGQEWSSKLINSNAFITSDFETNYVSERFISLGDFDTCISLNTQTKQFDSEFETSQQFKYCLATFTLPNVTAQEYHDQRSESFGNGSHFDTITELWLRLGRRYKTIQGICVPKQCTTEQLEHLLNKYFSSLNYGAFKSSVGFCQPQNLYQLDVWFLIAMFVFFGIIGLSIVSTLVYTLRTYWSPNVVDLANQFWFKNLLESFEIGANLKALYTRESRDTSLQFLDGIRSILSLFAVVLHTMYIGSINPLSEILLFNKYPSFYIAKVEQLGPLVNIGEKLHVGVGIFFMISGFVLTYSQLKRGGSVGPFWLYALMRWLRIAPSIVGIMGVTILAQKIGSGPLFHSELTQPYVTPCYRYWWTHLALINNFWSVKDMCGATLWFIPILFQLCLLLYPIFMLYYRKVSYAYLGCGALIGVWAFYPFVFTSLDIAGIMVYDPSDYEHWPPIQDMIYSYSSPIIYLLPFFGGAMLAMYLINRKQIKAMKPFRSDLMCLGFPIILLLLFVVPVPSHFKESTGSVLKHPIAILINQLLYVCIIALHAAVIVIFFGTKHSLTVRFLSSMPLYTLNQLSFGIYLVNFLLLWFNVHRARPASELNDAFIAKYCVLVYVESVALAVFLFVFFEMPFRRLSQLVYRRFAPSKRQLSMPLNAISNNIKE